MYIFGGDLLETFSRTITLHIQKIEQIGGVQNQRHNLGMKETKMLFVRVT